MRTVHTRRRAIPPVHIRPWRIDDVPGVVALTERAGGTNAAAALRDEAASGAAAGGRGGRFSVRLVADREGQVVGTAVARDRPVGPEGWLDVQVHVETEHRRRGIGSALVAALDDDLRSHPPAGLAGRVDARDRRSRDWAARQGFVPVGQEVRCVLDPQRAPGTPGLMPEGIDVFGLTDVDSAGERRLTKLVARLLTDAPELATWPGPRPASGGSVLDHWRPLAPDATWIAASGDEWVGVTIASRHGDDGLYTWFTGVDRRWRGAGLASALKGWAVSCARAAGVRRMVSDVASANTAMLSVNQALGATLETPAWIVHRPSQAGS